MLNPRPGFIQRCPPWTPEGMMEWAYRAADYVKKTGDVSEFQKKKGKFTKGEIFDYRFLLVVDCESLTLIVHPYFPNVVNKKGHLGKMKDAKGSYFMREMCKGIKGQPEGYWTVPFQNIPGTKKAAKMPAFSMKPNNSPYHLTVFSRNIDLSQEALNSRFISWLEKRRSRFSDKIRQSAKQATEIAMESLKK